MSPSTLVKPWNQETLSLAVELLRKGDVVAVPTETVYGLAGVSWNTEAVTRIFSAKARPSFDPLIAHVPKSWNSLALLEEKGVIQLGQKSAAWKTTVERLMQKFWPGPLTLLMPRHPHISELSCSGLPDVAVRMPAHPVFQALLEELQCPLSAPSANRFGRISPTRSQDVVDELAAELALVIEGGSAEHGVESTILHIDTAGRALCLRLGACPLEDIGQVLGYTPPLVAKEHPTLAPGMLERHYAPGKSLWLIESHEDVSAKILALKAQKIAWLRCGSKMSQGAERLRSQLAVTDFTLSSKADDKEAAQNLFPTLRAIDGGDFDLIVAEAPSETNGLWPAIRDRLQRAAIKNG